MSQMYLFYQGEQRGPYSEEQVRAMYVSGTITSDVQYWQEGQAEWLPIDELFASQREEQSSLSVPSVLSAGQQSSMELLRQSPPDSESNKATRNTDKRRILAVLMLLIACILGLILFSLFSAQKVKKEQALAIQSRQIPIEIKQALNDIRSAVSTGIGKDGYINLVIVLKSSIATYGQNIPSDEATALDKIVDNYSLVIQLWNKIETNSDDSVSYIILSKTSDSPLYDALNAFNIQPIDGDALYAKDNPYYYQYSRDSTFGLVWATNEKNINLLLSDSMSGSVVPSNTSAITTRNSDSTFYPAFTPSPDALHILLDADNGFLSIPWGSSKDEVSQKLALNGYILANDETSISDMQSGKSLVYSGGIFDNFPVYQLTIYFYSNRKTGARIQFQDFSSADNDKIKDALLNKYGQPKVDATGMLTWTLPNDMSILLTSENIDGHEVDMLYFEKTSNPTFQL